jgi:hypothetical protein
MMIARQLKDLPTVLTCFVLRDEYFSELDGMLATVERHHPDWPWVIGRGVLTNDGGAIFDVEAPSGQSRWPLPVPLNLGGGEDDWRKITRIKGWWLSEVWNHFGGLADPLRHRVLWLDADGRLNAPLEIELDPMAEAIAAPWWFNPNDSAYDTITSGLLLLQGASHGPVAKILSLWSHACLQQIEHLGPSIVPWADSDQEVLTTVLAQLPESDSNYSLLKLDHDRYCGIPDAQGDPQPDALVDQWMMSAKMGRKGRRGEDWPPPEHLRRASRE